MRHLIVPSNLLPPIPTAVYRSSDHARSESEATVEDLSESEVADLRNNPNIEAVVPSIPFVLPKKIRSATAKTAWGIEAVGAAGAQPDCESVTVAVLDTGIDKGHAAFKGIKWTKNNLMDFSNDEKGVAGSALDDDGHGTHVAGTIFGRDVDGIRIGVAPSISKILIGKVLGRSGGSTEAVFNGILWALRSGADIISMSLGMDYPGVLKGLLKQYPEEIAASRALEAYRANVRLFDRLAFLVDATIANGKGALLVAASGNESDRDTNPRHTVAASPPATADGFLPIGAVSKDEKIASFSNTGCRLAAPGVDILSAKVGGGLTTMSGTSMATPHVAGVLALYIRQIFPNGDRPSRWAREVESEIESNAKNLKKLSRNDIGRGLVQVPPPAGSKSRSPNIRTRTR